MKRIVQLVLAICWVALGSLALPFTYLMLAFSTDSGGGPVRTIATLLLFFYYHLWVQSIVALCVFKRIVWRKGYLTSLSMIIFAPAILIGSIISTAPQYDLTETMWLVLIITTVALQLVGSVWVWILIGTIGAARPLGAPISPVLEPLTATTDNRSMKIDKKYENLFKLVAKCLLTLFLSILVIQLIIARILEDGVSVSDGIYTIRQIANGVLGGLLLPCLVAAGYLYQKRKR